MNGLKLKRRQKIWVDFIKAKHVFELSKSSTICSNHFKPEDFERRFHMLPGQTKPNFQKLRKDDLGVCVFPSIHATPKGKQKELPTISPRSRRMVRFSCPLMCYFFIPLINIPSNVQFCSKYIYIYFIIFDTPTDVPCTGV